MTYTPIDILNIMTDRTDRSLIGLYIEQLICDMADDMDCDLVDDVNYQIRLDALNKHGGACVPHAGRWSIEDLEAPVTAHVKYCVGTWCNMETITLKPIKHYIAAAIAAALNDQEVCA